MAAPDSTATSERREVEILLPISRNWELLGTGGGIEAFLAMFISEASKRGVRTTVLCPGTRPAVSGSVRIVPIMSEARTEFAFTRRLRREVLRGKVSIPPHAVVLANTEHYAWAFRGLGIPIVLMSHGAIPATLGMRHTRLFVQAYRYFIERPAVLSASHIVVVSTAVKDYYLRSYPHLASERLLVLPIGLEIDSLTGRPREEPFQRLGLPQATPLVVFVGRLYPEKNPMLFVAACDALRRENDSVHAVVVGDGVLADKVRDAALSRPWLHWIPVMEHSDVLDLMAIANAVVVCSSYESGPLVLLEAIGVGTPVVSTDVGRARELISGDLGRIVEPDPVALGQGVDAVLKIGKEPLGAATRQARERIDFKDTMQRLVGLIQSAADSRVNA